jgi:hypothetical protein
VSSTSDSSRGLSASLLGSLLALLLGLCAPTRLAAQSGGSQDAGRDASARALFEEGVSFVEHADWPRAEDRFRRALALRDSPVIAFNLASTLSEQGKLVEASELLRKLQRDPGLDQGLHKSASDLHAQIMPRIARVRVHVENAAAGDAVQLDGAPLLDAQLNVEIPIDPGSHELQLQRDGASVVSEPFELAEGGTRDVSITAPAALSPRAVAASQPVTAPAPAAAATQPADHAGPITSKWWFWTGLAVVVAGAAVTVAVVASGGDPAPAPRFQGDFKPSSLALEVSP